MEIRVAQNLVFENKQTKGFNVSSIPTEICLLQGEIAEFFDAWRRGGDDVGEELADVTIYILGLASMLELDLQSEIAKKIEVNARRCYELRGGVPVRVG